MNYMGRSLSPKQRGQTASYVDKKQEFFLKMERIQFVFLTYITISSNELT